MAKRIVLFLSERRKEAPMLTYTCPDGTEVTGTQTNEAPVKYLLQANPDVREILCIVTPAAEATAWADFQKEIRTVHEGVVLTKIPFGDGEDFESGPLTELMESVHQDDEILLETTGGFRNAIIHLLLLSRILAYSGIRLAGAVYSNYQSRRIEDASHFYEMFDLVNGMQELTNLGSVRTLRKYCSALSEDRSIDALLTAMERLSEAITLCRTRQIGECMENFGRAMEEAENCRDPLMRQLLPAFRRKFGKKLNTTGLIMWCINSDMLQQALTVYTERIPNIILRRGDILQVDDMCVYKPYRDPYEDPDYALLMRSFLTMSSVSHLRKDGDNNFYALTVENLGELIPGSGYKAKRSVAELQIICRDYLYIKTLRNITNHAGGEGSVDQTALLEYLSGYQYKDPSLITMEDLRMALLNALDHLRFVEKKKAKKQ